MANIEDGNDTIIIPSASGNLVALKCVAPSSGDDVVIFHAANGDLCACACTAPESGDDILIVPSASGNLVALKPKGEEEIDYCATLAEYNITFYWSDLDCTSNTGPGSACDDGYWFPVVDGGCADFGGAFDNMSGISIDCGADYSYGGVSIELRDSTDPGAVLAYVYSNIWGTTEVNPTTGSVTFGVVTEGFFINFTSVTKTWAEVSAATGLDPLVFTLPVTSYDCPFSAGTCTVTLEPSA